MAKIIRVDDDVWAEMQRRGRPFETPNEMLRREFGIDNRADGTRHQARSVPRGRRRSENAKELIERYGLDVAQGFYHRDGKFYMPLDRFPSVLCDPRGYVRYDKEEQYLADGHIRRGDTRLNVPRGLENHPRYSEYPQRSSRR